MVDRQVTMPKNVVGKEKMVESNAITSWLSALIKKNWM